MRPWGYRRAFGCCALLFLLGTVIQFLAGPVPPHFLRYPWSVIAALVYVYALVMLCVFSDRFPRLRRLYDPYAGFACLVSVTLLAVIFGLVPQTGESRSPLGWTAMRSSWSFCLLMLALTTGIGADAIAGLLSFRRTRRVATLSHLSVFLVLLGGIFGAGDKQTVRVSAELDRPVAFGWDASGQEVSLPFMLTLKEFTIDEYPARLCVSDGSSEEFLEVTRSGEKGTLASWELEVLDYLPMAVRFPDEEAFRALTHVGACPAARVRARCGEQVREGWVSCGSFLLESAGLDLGEGRVVWMPRPSPRQFRSELILSSPREGAVPKSLSVNHPARHGAWRIYQAGYDESRGRWSQRSDLLCVRDGWYPLIAAGLCLLLVAGVLMMVSAGSRPKKKSKL